MNAPVPKTSRLALLVGISALGLLWVSIFGGVDPNQIIRQHVDSQMLVWEFLLVFVVVVLLLVRSRTKRADRYWFRPFAERAASARVGRLPRTMKEESRPAGKGSIHVEWIAGPERAPAGVFVREGLAEGRQVRVIGHQAGASRRELIGSREAPKLAAWDIRVSDEELYGWISTREESFTLVLLGAGALRGWVLGERAEHRLARMIRDLPKVQVSGRIILVEPSSLDRVVRADAFTRDLLEAVDHVSLWDGTERVEPAEASRGIGWYLAHGRGRHGLGRSGSTWDARLFGSAAIGVMILALAMVFWPTFGNDYAGTPLLGRVDDALPGSLWSNWWVAGWWSGANELFYSEMIFWPRGIDIVPLFGNIGASLVSIPFQALGDYPDYWNLWVASCLLANGLATYWLARQIGAERGGALLAGVAILLCSPVLAEVEGGHQSQFLMAGLPLCIGLSIRALDLDRWWEPWALGVALVLTSVVWWVMGGVAWFVFLLLTGHRAWKFRARRPGLWVRLWHTFRVWIPCLLMAGPLISLANMDQLDGSSWGRLVHDSSDSQVEDLMLASLFERSVEPMRLIMGEGGGFGSFVAPVILVLLLTAWWWFAPVRGGLWLWLLGGSALVSLGPYLHPSAGFSEDWLVMPTGWVQALVPFATRFHHPDRMLIVGMLALAMMGSLLYRPILFSLRSEYRKPSFVLCLSALFVLPWTQSRLPITVYDFDEPHWMSLLGQEGAIVELPLGMSETTAMYQPIHGRSVSTGPGIVRQIVDGEGYLQVLQNNPGMRRLWQFDPSIQDASSVMRLRDEGLSYVVVNSRVIEYLVETRGMDWARGMLLVSRWVDDTLGPPVLSTTEARVYRVPSEEQGAALLAMQQESTGPVPEPGAQPVGDHEALSPPLDVEPVILAPSFDDLESVFSPDPSEP